MSPSGVGKPPPACVEGLPLVTMCTALKSFFIIFDNILTFECPYLLEGLALFSIHCPRMIFHNILTNWLDGRTFVQNSGPSHE